MSDTNLVEAFSKAMKKANIFEKAIEIKRILTGFIVLTTIMGTTIIINQIYKKQSISSFESRIDALDKKIEKLVENNATLYEIIMQNNKLSNKFIENQLLHICNKNNAEIEGEETRRKEETETKEEPETRTKEEYDELLDECYDSMPCNNSKKVIGITKIFNWN
jgi:hypothetical protein